MSRIRTIKIISALVVLSVAAAGWIMLQHEESDARLQSTDNAYIQADFTLVSPRIAGQIIQVLVEENQQVKAGELLAILDDRDQKLAIDTALAEVETAQALIESLSAKIAQQDMLIRQAGAAVSADNASLGLAKLNLTRYQNLAEEGAGTRQEAQQGKTQVELSQAALERDRAAYDATRQQLKILQADLKKATAGRARAEAALATAQLNLEYTRIKAPIDGTIGRRSLRNGAYVTVGMPLLAIVPLEAIYIEANYRETQLAHVGPGQRVNIQVDALPGVKLTGRVASLAPASNIAFSPVAPHNATGNFTKIIQRLPVRIELDPGQAAIRQLKVGMSATPVIQTAPADS